MSYKRPGGKTSPSPTGVGHGAPNITMFEVLLRTERGK